MRTWIGRNPTWFWKRSQVTDVLSIITTHWAQVLSRPRYVPPPSVSLGSPDRQRIHRDKRIERIAYIYDKPRPRMPWDGDELPLGGDSERALYAAVIRRAFIDYGVGVVSPLARLQRDGLNAYWWVMGLPLVLTRKSLERPEIALPDLSAGRTRRWKATGGDLFADIAITTQKLVTLPKADEPYYPEPWRCLEVDHRLMTFSRCCDICGVDVDRARTWLHVVRPDE